MDYHVTYVTAITICFSTTVSEMFQMSENRKSVANTNLKCTLYRVIEKDGRDLKPL